MVTAIRRSLESASASGARVIVGLSGGPDSMALLDGVLCVADERELAVVAAHLDHGLREGSDNDAAFCGALCRSRGVPFRTARADVRARAQKDKRGLEDAARKERYAFLKRVAKEEGARFVLVGHNQNDQAETLLMHLLRGAGTTGLAAMRPRRGMLLRPLLDVPREQILAHLEARGLAFLQDPSNESLAFTRNRIRLELLPILRTLNPRVVEALARTARLLRRDDEGLRAVALGLRPDWTPTPEGGRSIPVAVLVATPAAVAARVIVEGLKATGGRRSVGALHIESLVRLARSNRAMGRRVVLPGNREAVFEDGRLTLRSASIRAKARRTPP